MTPWREKANRLIANLSMMAYREANYRNGKKLKRHVPYSIPALASQLVECLNKNDEHQAKALFLSYDGLNAI